MKTPTEVMLDRVAWKEITVNEGDVGDLPYATHEGVLEIGNMKLRCYQLNDGRRIFDAEDVSKFFGTEDS